MQVDRSLFMVLSLMASETYTMQSTVPFDENIPRQGNLSLRCGLVDAEFEGLGASSVCKFYDEAMFKQNTEFFRDREIL